MTHRIVLLRRVMVVGLCVLVVGLGNLQLVHGARYRRLAEENRLRVVPRGAARGTITDRTGREVASSRVSFRIALVPQDVPARSRMDPPTGAKGADAVFEELAILLGQEPAELKRRFALARGLPFVPAALTGAVPKSVALQVEEARVHLPGVLVEEVVTRHYPFGSLAAQVLGYVGVPTARRFPALKRYGVRPNDLVGRTGVERDFDAYLRGRSGGSLIEVDHRARQVRLLGHREPRSGTTVMLTIDAGLQSLIEESFGEQPGSCVVLQPDTGEVLAMASMPQFSPKAFALQDQAAIRAFLTDPAAPLMNRATQGTYTPGSIIKPVTAMTALEQGVVSASTTINCAGYITIGGRRFHCWKRDGHGSLTVREALAASCNVFFMQLGRRLGLGKLRLGLSRVGFGRRTRWAFGEQAGQLPAGRRFSEGEVALLAMGQGEILITPLQAAVMVSAIANGGWLIEPWIVQSVGGQPVGRPHSAAIGWSGDSLRVVHGGLVAVVNHRGSTGHRARSAQVTIAGKTGTAQTHLPGRNHGWFIGYCPAERPVAAFAIVAEYGGSGGGLPARIGKSICEYLSDTLAGNGPGADSLRLLRRPLPGRPPDAGRRLPEPVREAGTGDVAA